MNGKIELRTLSHARDARLDLIYQRRGKKMNREQYEKEIKYLKGRVSYWKQRYETERRAKLRWEARYEAMMYVKS